MSHSQWFKIEEEKFINLLLISSLNSNDHINILIDLIKMKYHLNVNLKRYIDMSIINTKISK